MSHRCPVLVAAVCGLVIPAAFAAATPREVQIRSVDFDAGVLEVFSFASEATDLSGWRFCSHDFDQSRRYTGAAGLDGVTLDAGSSVFVHFNNDAPAGDPGRINRSSLGGSFALPLSPDAYGIQLFNPDANGNVSFGNSSLIADHLQWATNPAGIGSAATRSDQAVDEGLWPTTGDFVLTPAGSARVDLIDLSGDAAGSPAEYAVRRANTLVNEATDGDLSDDALAPTPLALALGSNIIEGTVEASNNLAAGDRDFVTFDVPQGRALTGVELLAWDPDNTGFIAVNAGPTGFVPSGGTSASFLAGVLVGASNTGDNLLENLRDQSVTVNALAEARLPAGNYTFVVQQTSNLVQSYAIDFQLTEAGGCNPADIAVPLGLLDLSDIDAFISGFAASDAVADIAPPIGVLDLSDIDTFIASFGAGCP